jgi:hypothetical protein
VNFYRKKRCGFNFVLSPTSFRPSIGDTQILRRSVCHVASAASA